MASLFSFPDEAKLIFDTLSDRAAGLISPSIRLGVTGLSQAGKTVFITAFVRALLQNNRLPLFKVSHEQRLLSAELNQQPDDHLARFEYEKHLNAILNDRIWPQSTRMLSELRVKVLFRPQSGLTKYFNRGNLTIDIIDYPGEWLLDLPLLQKTYREFSNDSLKQAEAPHHRQHANRWLSAIRAVNILKTADEETAKRLAEEFTTYLKAAKADPRAISMLPPGRFLMPGDFEGAPLLTFAPLPIAETMEIPENSLAAMMERRYEAYKQHIVRPFFREHIARLDRQIILIDAMQAFNAGPDAVEELERTLGEILGCFRPGQNNWITNLFRHRIDRVLVAATKADQLHHTDHDRLQNLTRQLVEATIAKTGLSGANIGSLALSSVRATHEAETKQGSASLPVVVGTPMAGETINGIVFDGKTETAIFPGDLPEKLADITGQGDLRFIRFRPPHIAKNAPLPHIRLDRALEFLLGDQFS